MPSVKLTIVDPPESYKGYTDFKVSLPLKSEVLPATRTAEGWEIEVPIVWKADEISGPAVHRNPDKRRFVYLTWEAAIDGRWVRYGRIKIYQEQMGIEPGGGGEVRIAGRDSRGGPACATARLA